jgi:hypothetical protein
MTRIKHIRESIGEFEEEIKRDINEKSLEL